MNVVKLPPYFKPYFWDIDYNSLDLHDNAGFVIKRVLDRGNTKAIKWLFNNYSITTIKNILFEIRDISPKTANFWADALKLDKSKIACLQKPYSPIQFGLSS